VSEYTYCMSQTQWVVKEGSMDGGGRGHLAHIEKSTIHPNKAEAMQHLIDHSWETRDPKSLRWYHPKSGYALAVILERQEFNQLLWQ